MLCSSRRRENLFRRLRPHEAGFPILELLMPPRDDKRTATLRIRAVEKSGPSFSHDQRNLFGACRNVLFVQARSKRRTPPRLEAQEFFTECPTELVVLGAQRMIRHTKMFNTLYHFHPFGYPALKNSNRVA